MFVRHHQPPPSGVINAKIDHAVGIRASSARPSAPSGEPSLSSSTSAARAIVTSIRARITGTSARRLAPYSASAGIEGRRSELSLSMGISLPVALERKPPDLLNRQRDVDWDTVITPPRIDRR